ncbi:ABC transmembrane type-1 domain-containing protein [Smaragdicoccus niigatensis]
MLSALWQLTLSGDLWISIDASLHRSLTGLLVAVSIAVPLGLLIAWYSAVAEVLSPLLAIFLNTAAVALLPVFTLILGIGDLSKIAIIGYACFWPILYNTISGARTVDPLLIKSARSLGLKDFKLFYKVIVPAALPTIFTGLRLATAASMLVLITTEYVGAKAGLGYLIISSQFNFQIPQMYAGILTVSIIGLGLNYLLVFVESRVTKWRPKQ